MLLFVFICFGLVVSIAAITIKLFWCFVFMMRNMVNLSIENFSI